MKVNQRLPGILYGAGFAILLVYVFPSLFGVQTAEDGLLLTIGLVLTALGGIFEITGTEKVRESSENA